jgi:hypothetical protein
MLCGLAVGEGALAGGSQPACAPGAAARVSIDRVNDELDETARAVATHPVTLQLEFADADGSFVSVSELKGSGPGGLRVSGGGSEKRLSVIAPSGGAIPISLSWVQGCGTATGQVTVQVLAAKPTQVNFRKEFSGGPWHGAFGVSLRRLRGGDGSPIRLVVRARRGTLRPPSTGRAVLDQTVPMGTPADGVPDTLGDLKRQNAAVEVIVAGHTQPYKVYVTTRLPDHGIKHYRLKAGIAIEAFQTGRRIFVMTTGLNCRENASGGFIKGYRCATSGFHQKP